MTDKSDLEKLRILLDHWIDHNHSHEAEMDKWQKVAAASNQEKAAAHIREAIAGMKETDKALAKALEALGGQIEGHQHHHHH